MKHRVYFRIPAYTFIEVHAETKEEAIQKAQNELVRTELSDEPLSWEVDWEADAEFAFTLSEGTHPLAKFEDGSSYE